MNVDQKFSERPSYIKRGTVEEFYWILEKEFGEGIRIEDCEIRFGKFECYLVKVKVSGKNVQEVFEGRRRVMSSLLDRVEPD